MYFKRKCVVFPFAFFIFLTHCQSNVSGQTVNVGPLPSLNVYNKWITLSGFSSGGTFAQMFQISHSSLIHGIAVFSHTFYRCGPPTGKVNDYDQVCTKLFNFTGSQLYNPERVHRDIATYFQSGAIDNPSNLRNKFLYVYSGLRNSIFTTDQSLGILNVYERYIKNPYRIKTRVQDAEHVLPTNNGYGVACTQRSDNRSFIGNCGFSGAYEALNHLVGSDQRIRQVPTATGSFKSSLMKRLKPFDQREFVTGLNRPHMDAFGYFYVPSNCEKRRCLLHFYFHGCLTGREYVNTKHIENTGFLEVAEANDIVIIFPQAVLSQPENEIGCWDTFGISGPLYATKQGDQIIAVKRMLDRAMATPSNMVDTGASSSSNSNNWWGSSSSDGTKGNGRNQFRRRNNGNGRQKY